MPPSLWFLAGWISVLGVVDWLFMRGSLPGGTISAAAWTVYKRHRVVRLLFWLAILALDYHLFGYAP